MHKTVLPFLCGLVLAATSLMNLNAREAGERLVVGTTIDFLDYCFESNEPEGYLTLATYEKYIRQMAEGGIRKIYLRVNACGSPNYPTLVSERYGTHGRFHWYSMAASLKFQKTLDTYDNLAETIRLGHKYGMEVWAWDSLNDDGGVRMLTAVPPEYAEAAKRLNNCPLMEPAYLTHPEWQAQRKPGYGKSPAEAASINAKARRLPIVRVVMRDTGNVKAAEANKPFNSFRIKEEEIELYTSEDNVRYTRYAGPVKMRGYRDGKGVLCCELSGFSLKGPYFKLAHPIYADAKWSIAVRNRMGDCFVYNSDGEEVEHVWAQLTDPSAGKENTSFSFDTFIPTGWDYKHYQLGFALGCFDVEDGPQYYGGFTEFAVPDALAFRLRKFSEIANYPFDGFMINIRTHSIHNLCPGGDPRQFGYNPEVRQKTVARCGKDPLTDDSAYETMQQVRAEAVADYLKGCKTLVGTRPLYLSGPSPKGKHSDRYQHPYGDLPWLYGRYFADGSVDGVMMIGSDFREELTPEVLQGRKVKLGVFREMLFPPAGYDLGKDLEALRNDPQIDEVELYETLVLTRKPQLYEETRK